VRWVLLALRLLEGCTAPVICNAPHIHHETGCCLDTDANSICDEDHQPRQGHPPNERPTDDLGPVVLYNLEENLNDDGGNRNGRAVGDSIRFSKGHTGKAATFSNHGLDRGDVSYDSRVRVNLPNPDSWDEATVAVWAKFNDHPYEGIVLGFEQAEPWSHRHMNHWPNGLIMWGIGDANAGSTVITVGNLSNNEWHHIAVTWNLNDMTSKVYLDGELAEEKEISTYGPLSNTFWYGGWLNGFGMNGKLDEIAIRQRELSADEIKTLATS
jgi:hypothetical protein